MEFPSRGARVGRYTLLDQVGEGAMGMVFAASDPELERKVAIKLLRPAPGETGSTAAGQARLLREAQAMAKLSDPNVVPIYDTGPFQNGVFLAMELVEGETLRAWITKGVHPWPDVLRLLRQAGLGLSAAHRAGIIHRDFKPSNVLIGKDGRARVGDFGIARSKDAPPPVPLADVPPPTTAPARGPSEAPTLGPETPSTSLTHPLTIAGSLMGTPGYMAPEQYRGELATALTDQFAFCVALFEALYGKRPFAGHSLEEASANTLAGRMAPVPKDSKVPAWVHRIVLRGLALAPSERHASMDALLAALGDDPSVKRARRWRLVAAALFATSLIAGTGLWVRHHNQLCAGASRQLGNTWDAAASARVRAGLEGTHLRFSASTAQSVVSLLDAYAARWVAAYTEACEATQLRGEQSEQVLDLRMACLSEKRNDLGALAELLAKADAKTAENAVAAALELPPLSRCADITALTQPSALPSDPVRRAQVESVLKDLAHAESQSRLGKFKEVSALLPPLIDAARHSQHAPALARALALQAQTETTLNNPKVEELFQAAFAAAEQAHLHELAAKQMLGLADEVGAHQEHPAVGWTVLHLAQGLQTGAGHSDSNEIEGHVVAGRLASVTGKNELAIQEYGLALELAKKQDRRTQVGRILADLGWAQLDKGDVAGARASMVEAMKLREAEFGPDHPALLSSLNDLSRLEQVQGNYDEGMAYLRQAEALIDRVFGQKDRRFCSVTTNMINGYIGWERWADARRQAERAWDVCLDILGPDHPSLGVIHMLRGECWWGLGDGAKALEEHRAAQQLMERIHTDHPPFYCQAFRQQGEDLLLLGRPAEALKDAQRAAQCFDAAKMEGQRLAQAMLTQGSALVALHRNVEAVAPLRRSITLLEAAKSPPEDLAEVEFVLAQALWPKSPAESRQLARDAEDKYRARKRHDVTKVAAWRSRHP